MSVLSIETRIFEAIAAKVRALKLSTAHEIVWTEGDETNLTPSKRYLRCTWTPNQTQRVFVGSNEPHWRPGVLQIDVLVPTSVSSGVAREQAGQIAAQFNTDLSMTFMGIKVKVLKAPSVLSVFKDTHVQVPVIIELETLA